LDILVSAAELEHLYKEFVDTTRNSLRNGLESYDLPAILNAISPNWSRVNLSTTKRLFQLFDTNQDGVLDFPELLLGISPLLKGPVDDLLKRTEVVIQAVLTTNLVFFMLFAGSSKSSSPPRNVDQAILAIFREAQPEIFLHAEELEALLRCLAVVYSPDIISSSVFSTTSAVAGPDIPEMAFARNRQRQASKVTLTDVLGGKTKKQIAEGKRDDTTPSISPPDMGGDGGSLSVAGKTAAIEGGESGAPSPDAAAVMGEAVKGVPGGEGKQERKVPGKEEEKGKEVARDALDDDLLPSDEEHRSERDEERERCCPSDEDSGDERSEWSLKSFVKAMYRDHEDILDLIRDSIDLQSAREFSFRRGF
jgi:hypothetical protein